MPAARTKGTSPCVLWIEVNSFLAMSFLPINLADMYLHRFGAPVQVCSGSTVTLLSRGQFTQ